MAILGKSGIFFGCAKKMICAGEYVKEVLGFLQFFLSNMQYKRFCVLPPSC